MSAVQTGDVLSKCSKGPWRVSLTDETVVLAADGRVVVTTYTSQADYDAHYGRRAADAQLISAARELLIAAKEALTQAEGCFLNHYPGDDPSEAAEPLHMATLREAIAKAEGRP